MKNKPWLKYLPLIGGGLLVLIVAIIVYVFRDAFEKPAQSKKQVQQVSVVRPPPPLPRLHPNRRSSPLKSRRRKRSPSRNRSRNLKPPNRKPRLHPAISWESIPMAPPAVMASD